MFDVLILREVSNQVGGMRDRDILEYSDSWVDDPITRHVIY